MVNKKKLPTRWDRLAKESLDDIYKYISQDSPQNARKVKKELIKLAGSLSDFPDKYSREEFLKEEPENYRSVSKWSYKIIYEVTDEAANTLLKSVNVSNHDFAVLNKVCNFSKLLKNN